MNYRDQLVEFYQKYNPAKLGEVDALLQTFSGREESMFAALRAKYQGESSRGASLNLSGVTSGSGAGAVDVVDPTADEGSAVQAELQGLLCDMEAVDLTKVLGQMAGQARVEGPLLAHALTFMQHFATCARRFQELSASVTAARVPHTARRDAATQVEAATAGRQDAAVQSEVATAGIATQTGRIGVEDACSPSRNDMNDDEDVSLGQAQVSPMNSVTLTPNSTQQMSVPIEVEEEEENSDMAIERRVIGRVHKLQPETRRRAAVIGPILESGHIGDTDSIVLHPGVYHENLHFVGSGAVELVAVFPGAAVIIKPLSTLEPVIRAEGSSTQLRVSGVVLVEKDAVDSTPEDPLAQGTPLVVAAAGARVDLHGCHLYQGSCAVEAMGAQTVAHLRLCVLSSCAFAGIFAHHGARAVVAQCKVRLCEAGIRVASKSSLHARETVVEENVTDGVVAYEGAVGLLQRCSVLRNGGNGVFLATGAALTVAESVVELNGLYGVQRLQGATLRLRDGVVRDNALLPVNDADGALDA
ncbi:hypothetical protein DQ04_03421040 [Trypanosoma grayi]|uniref:hypothetical protein n=1 Tax=Trypanosoma grayi TaxID=71804 RepID=UPI0004F47598|nr:hypothetical protein DQ04_03421040 [Trypanosoma grayi]KEG10678.1 hypothetical protein DQ04_03421040 [Trypanosoma grayi]